MIRIDLKKEDYQKIKSLISDPVKKNPSLWFSTTEEHEMKFEIFFDQDSEAKAFQDILLEMNITILKKRVF